MVVASLRGLAATWYQECVQSTEAVPELLPEFEKELRQEFEPADLQDRLKDQLFNLNQRDYQDLMDHGRKFRKICTKIIEMTERDKISLFTRGLIIRTREEVIYSRPDTVRKEIQIALDFERVHSV